MKTSPLEAPIITINSSNAFRRALARLRELEGLPQGKVGRLEKIALERAVALYSNDSSQRQAG